MKNLNAEQIKKALECCGKESSSACEECPIDEKIKDDYKCCSFLARNSLKEIARLEKLCKSREQDYNDICDLLYKKEEKTKKLTEERDTFRECAYNLQKYVKSFAENQAQGYEPSAAKAAAEMEMWRVVALEKKALTEDNEAKDETITNLLATIADIQAEAVRKMLQRIKEDAVSVSLLSNPPKFMLEIREDALDQIAKEMLEGEVCGNTK